MIVQCKDRMNIYTHHEALFFKWEHNGELEAVAVLTWSVEHKEEAHLLKCWRKIYRLCKPYHKQVNDFVPQHHCFEKLHDVQLHCAYMCLLKLSQ